MTHEQMRGWLEIAGMLAIVISLVFVGLQIRQDQGIAIAETYGSVASTSLQLSELIGGRSDLWRRGLDGEELSSDEHIDFLSLADAVESSFETGWSRAVFLGVGRPENGLRDYAMALHSHVGLRGISSPRLIVTSELMRRSASLSDKVRFGAGLSSNWNT